MREATRGGVYNSRPFSKTADVYSDILYTSGHKFFLLGIKDQRPPMQFPLLFPKNISFIRESFFG